MKAGSINIKEAYFYNKKLSHYNAFVGTVPLIDAEDIEFVDLGLSVEWAKWNVGATSETECGDYYSWGETELKSNYDWSTYKYAKGANNKLTKYCLNNSYQSQYWGGDGDPDNLTLIQPIDDAANIRYGENWRIPTVSELGELEALQSKWVTNYKGVQGLNGRVFTGTNGNTLFIPAAGYKSIESTSRFGTHGYLWSSRLETNMSPAFSETFIINSTNGYNQEPLERAVGVNIRPVKGLIK